MVEFSRNKWKYSTIGLMAILAVGFSFPQASAHITNSVQHVVSDIYNFVDTEVLAIKAKTDNLPTDPADQSLVEGAITTAKGEINTNTNTAVSGLATASSVADLQSTIDEIGPKFARGAIILNDDAFYLLGDGEFGDEETMFSGQITLNAKFDNDNPADLRCYLRDEGEIGDSSSNFVLTTVTYGTGETVHFNCNSLILQQFEGDSGNTIAYAMQYWETNEAEEIDSSTQT
jgi:hypothetical protein